MNITMKIYLDIDGTMIHEDTPESIAAAGLAEFLIALRPYDTYWLTTHCRDGNPARPREIMKRFVPPDLYADIDRIKPTVWDTMKTQGIDWDSDFIWFDNNIMEGERTVLKRCTPGQYVVEVDLKANPRQLEEIVRDVLA
jgi:hypothetical protein